ncbi:uncharacterized protein PG998_004578 [Apiospora kogelbergensis]|uniref:uncharacterized protein n=1 Tax=Apiospora kogelbergensis TaxID=1337665 RepID=UPI00312F38B4
MPDEDQPGYVMENDAEAERLAYQHTILKASMGGQLVVAPVDLSRRGLRILDSGTSNGVWLSDVRGQVALPDAATLIGTDASAARFPVPSPAGVTFAVHDIRNPWPPEWKGSFDLVHQRLVLAGAGPDVSGVLHGLLETVAPGGWVQLMEGINRVSDDHGPVMKQFQRLMMELFDALGTGNTFSADMSTWISEAGFANVESRMIPYDIGAKAKDPDLQVKSTQVSCIAASGLVAWANDHPGGVSCMSRHDLDTLESRLRTELSERGGSYPMRVVWGQKPLDGSEGAEKT